jgi:hypothetical protein
LIKQGGFARKSGFREKIVFSHQKIKASSDLTDLKRVKEQIGIKTIKFNHNPSR